MAWNDGLEGPALDIAACRHSPLRVVAGPGTGKTFALKRRVARLLEEGIPPDQILLVTFTRMAARDTEREIMDLNIPGAARVRKGTLHSFCFSTLNSANVLQVTRRTPRPLMLFEERFMLEDLGLEQDDPHEDYNHRKSRLNAFEAAWARQQDQQPGWPITDPDRHFQGILNEWLLFHKAILIGELVPVTLRYLRDNPGCSERRQYRYVLVDEYQDLNRAEQCLIDFLAENSDLTVVGDEDQSIYEAFRYAHPEGISQFDREHHGTLDIPMVECRRCPTRIVSMANQLILTNRRRVGHPLLPRHGKPRGIVHVVQWQSMQDEVEGIAEYITSKINAREFVPGKTLVLCPTRQFGYSIRDALIKHRINAHSFFHEEILEGQPKELNDSQPQQAFTLLTLLVNQEDLVALRCWLGFGSQNLRAKEYQRLSQYCANNGISQIEALRLLSRKEINIPYTTGLVERYILLSQYQDNLVGRTVEEIINTILPSDQAWAEPLRALIGPIGRDGELGEVLKQLRENIVQPELPTDVDYIRIMSLHKSKGLNAENVIITGCIEGVIPTAPDDEWPFEQQQRYIEEQRRLFYVAITRASKTLVLSSILSLPRSLAHRLRAQIHGGDNQNGETITSTFISDLGPECPLPIQGADFLAVM
jgi:DNA helicase II / ATP-dependent DNA helicase PcrA